MMAAAREWLTAVAAVSLLLSMVQMLLPKGTLREVAGLIGGLILLTVLMRPVLAGKGKDLRLDLPEVRQSVEQRQAELEAEGRETLTGLIEEKTAAYISDKAETLGLTLRIRVTAEDREGVPVPVQVELTGARSEELAHWLETELGLSAERQVWNEN